ncbi:hypothetical protein EG329_004868 [Mollisiaceae sp. DMI_Dod_QoI]|nr:hypothetical protein EG329_004868 [Helotiales sp. DMI_Dod_QoI]
MRERSEIRRRHWRWTDEGCVADEAADALVGQLGQGRAERGRVGRWRRAPVGLCAGPLRNRQNAALLSACESAVGAGVVLRTENGVLAECLTLMRDGMNEPTGAMDLTLFSDTGQTNHTQRASILHLQLQLLLQLPLASSSPDLSVSEPKGTAWGEADHQVTKSLHV